MTYNRTPAPYTDLAMELAQSQTATAPIPGLDMTEDRSGEIAITRVIVSSTDASRAVGKPPGTYVTLSADLRRRAREIHTEARDVLTSEFETMAKLAPDTPVLVVGLGNWNATPDALGPRVVNMLFATRHLKGRVSDELADQFRPVSAIAPGVLGITGIETGEIVRGLVEHVKPGLVVAVDSLAAGSVERILNSIQLSDTGIQPGSGVGNDAMGITQEVLGVPVIAIGVPTVVHALTIANETLNSLSQRPAAETGGTVPFTWRDPGQRHSIVDQAMRPVLGELIVTPKEIDRSIRDMARLIAEAINLALHPGLEDEMLWA